MTFKRIVLALAIVLLGIGQAGAATKGYSKLDVDRVMLFNNDSTNKVLGVLPVYSILCEGYYDTNTAAKAYWTHSNEAAFPVVKFLKGIHHEYFLQDGTPLWVVNQARVGSAYAATSTRNYLPWSSKYSVPLYSNVTNGSAILRNSTDAYILSPYYSDGIGTVYFDAVNAYVDWGSDYLYLEIATNTVAGYPLSATNAMDDADWQLASFDVLAVVNGATVSLVQSGVTNAVLASTAGGADYFYRIRAL